jgi:SRSO17 transposase
MERRFELRRKELLAECQVNPEAFEGMIERLKEFAEPFAACLRRREQKAHARTYLAGLLSDVKKKNVESIAYRHDQGRGCLQWFIGFSKWDHRPLVGELVRQVGQELGEGDAVIVFDPSGFGKKGRHSVGVARQWIGRLGKVDNGQVGVYMGYASRKEHAVVDERLYLPEEWAKDRARRRACGVPRDVRYETRHELALDMLKENRGLLPHTWIAGDDEMGRSTAFRRDLRALGERYLLAVPANTNVRDLESAPPPWAGRGARPKPPFQRADRWVASTPKAAWTEIDVRDGEKQPLRIEMLTAHVVARTEHSRTRTTEELLVVTRSPDENGKVKHDYYLSNASPSTPLEELARVTKAEHRIEECIRRAKSEAGLADYEVRTWAGWHHHQVLSLIAIWFLILQARRGKKTRPGHHRSADTPGLGDAPARRLQVRQSRPNRQGKDAATSTQRTGTILSLENT